MSKWPAPAMTLPSGRCQWYTAFVPTEVDAKLVRQDTETMTHRFASDRPVIILTIYSRVWRPRTGKSHLTEEEIMPAGAKIELRVFDVHTEQEALIYQATMPIILCVCLRVWRASHIKP